MFQGGRKSLADRYEYVMHGKLYKISEEGSGKSLKAYGPIKIHLYFTVVLDICFSTVKGTGLLLRDGGFIVL